MTDRKAFTTLTLLGSAGSGPFCIGAVPGNSVRKRSQTQITGEKTKPAIAGLLVYHAYDFIFWGSRNRKAKSGSCRRNRTG